MIILNSVCILQSESVSFLHRLATNCNAEHAGLSPLALKTKERDER